jgi:NAD+ synthase
MDEKKLEKIEKEIVEFIIQQLSTAGYKRIVVGLSGGIDSAVTAALSVKAVGKENVKAVMLPYRKSHPDSLNHARLVADKLGIEYQIVDISPMVDAYFDLYEPEADQMRRGNRMARERMCVLYDLSAKYKALVAGTGNRSELMIGYCTQYGDSACAFEPIGHLYKTEVKALAAVLDIPEEIIKKNPTADLWEAQTDEAEMGISYAKLDKILQNMLDLEKNKQELLQEGFTEAEIDKVMHLIKVSEFKRKMPPVLA